MHSSLIGHIQRHVDSYKRLVTGSAAAALVGAVTAIVYDNQAPHPWDVYQQDQQLGVQAATARGSQAAAARTLEAAAAKALEATPANTIK